MKERKKNKVGHISRSKEKKSVYCTMCKPWKCMYKEHLRNVRAFNDTKYNLLRLFSCMQQNARK